MRRMRARFAIECLLRCFDKERWVFVVGKGQRGEGCCVLEGLVVHIEVRVMLLYFELVVLVERFVPVRMLRSKHLISRYCCNSWVQV